MKRFRGLHNLRVLSLYNSPVTDTGLKELAHLTKLERLFLSRTAIRGDAFAVLRCTDTLRYLELESTPVDDEGVANLARFRNLRELRLSSTRITDRGLAALTSLTHLESLSFHGTRITEAGVACLAVLPRLKNVRFSSDQISETSLSRLRRLMPDAYVGPGWEVITVDLKELPSGKFMILPKAGAQGDLRTGGLRGSCDRRCRFSRAKGQPLMIGAFVFVSRWNRR